MNNTAGFTAITGAIISRRLEVYQRLAAVAAKVHGIRLIHLVVFYILS